MIVIQLIALALLGRWWGSDVFKFPLKKPLTCVLAGLLFLPNWYMVAAVAVGLYVGHLLRDSIFGLLKNPIVWKDLPKMTLRAFSFTLGALAAYYIVFGLNITPYLALCLLPVVSRAPIQLLCRLLPLPESADPKMAVFTPSPKGGWLWKQKLVHAVKQRGRLFFGGKAEIYELIHGGVAASPAPLFLLLAGIQA